MNFGKEITSFIKKEVWEHQTSSKISIISICTQIRKLSFSDFHTLYEYYPHFQSTPLFLRGCKFGIPTPVGMTNEVAFLPTAY